MSGWERTRWPPLGMAGNEPDGEALLDAVGSLAARLGRLEILAAALSDHAGTPSATAAHAVAQMDIESAPRPLRAADHPTTIFFCVHKGASTFIASDLAPALVGHYEGLNHVELGRLAGDGEPVPALVRDGMLVTRTYPQFAHHLREDPAPIAAPFATKPMVLLRRDPRDAAVSFYYSVANSHPAPERHEQPFNALRDAMQQASVAEGILEHAAGPVMHEFRAMFRVVDQYPHALVTTYEELVAEPGSWLRRVGQYIGWPGWVVSDLERDLAPRLQPPSVVDETQHIRRVTPGNWREVFTPQLRDHFEEHVGDLMERAGYTWEQ